MRFIYSALLYLLTPFLLARMLWRGLTMRDYSRRIPERLGHVSRVEGGVSVWVHAVSVGEAIAALPLIRRLVAENPPRSVLVTTMTPTGSARVHAALGDQVLHAYVPYDVPHAVRRFVARVQPRRVIVMETELWPNLFRVLASRGVPIIVANARLSARSLAGYSRVRAFVASTLADCRLIAAQSEADAERFRRLGAPAERVQVMGNLKFDFEMPQELVERGRQLRATLGGQRPVWIAASTHEGEEEVVLNAHRILLKRFRDATLILVPRHPQRFEAAAKAIERSGLGYRRRSSLEPGSAMPAGHAPVLLGDSMGEMPMYLAAADVAFVGGSLAEIGGHNVLEPAALGIPTVFGPHMFNFQAARDVVVASGAGRQIDTGLGLAPAISALLADPVRREHMGRAGRQAVADNRGALERLMKLLDEGIPLSS